MSRPLGGFAVATYEGERRVMEIRSLSYDAAREIAAAHALMGEDAVIASESADWREVWDKLGHRMGTFVETTDPRPVEEDDAALESAIAAAEARVEEGPNPARGERYAH